MAEKHPLPEPIDISIAGLGPQKFKTFEDVKRWADREKEAFAKMKPPEPRPHLPKDLAAGIDEHLSTLGNMSTWAKQAITATDKSVPNQTYKNIKPLLEQFGGYGRAHSQTARGQLILSTWDKNITDAAVMLRYLTPGALTVQDWRQLIDAGARLVLHEEGAIDSVTEEKAALEALKTDWNERLSEQEDRHEKASDEADALRKQISTTLEDQVRAHKDLVAEHEARMARIEKIFTKAMSLKAPAEYWATKRVGHRTTSIGAFVAFAVLVGVGIGLIAWQVPELFKAVTAEQGKVNWGQAAVITLPALAYFWLLRLVSRIFVSNLALMADAGERSTLITTYFALLKDEDAKMKDEERLLTLQAIFRPGPGQPSDEGPPAGFFELIKESRIKP